MSLLVKATKRGDLDLIQRLIKSGVSINGHDHEDGSTALYWASCAGEFMLCQRLIELGSDVNLPNSKKGSCPLHAACDRGHYQCASVLIRAGALIDKATTSNHDTPLHLASYRGYLALCRLLVDNGASLSAVNRQGNTPKEEALSNRNVKVYEFLQRAESMQLNIGRSSVHSQAKDTHELLAMRHTDPVRVNCHSAPLSLTSSSVNSSQQTQHTEKSRGESQQNGYGKHSCACAQQLHEANDIIRRQSDQIRQLETVNDQLKVLGELYSQKHSENQALYAELHRLKSVIHNLTKIPQGSNDYSSVMSSSRFGDSSTSSSFSSSNNFVQNCNSPRNTLEPSDFRLCLRYDDLELDGNDKDSSSFNDSSLVSRAAPTDKVNARPPNLKGPASTH